MPTLVDIRQDPFERTSKLRGQSWKNSALDYPNDFFARELWRFVMLQQPVAKPAQTAIDFPSSQNLATFNLDTVKKMIDAMVKQHEDQ